MLPIPPFSWFNRWVISMVGQWWVACHQRSGAVKAAAISAPAANQRLANCRPPPLATIPTARATANSPMLCLLANPNPRTMPAGIHSLESPVRPMRTTRRDRAVQKNMSKPVGPKRWSAPSSAGMVAAPRAPRSWAVRFPPNSRANRPARTTVPAPASADHSRSPGSETPNAHRESRAMSGVRTGWST